MAPSKVEPSRCGAVQQNEVKLRPRPSNSSSSMAVPVFRAAAIASHHQRLARVKPLHEMQESTSNSASSSQGSPSSDNESANEATSFPSRQSSDASLARSSPLQQILAASATPPSARMEVLQLFSSAEAAREEVCDDCIQAGGLPIVVRQRRRDWTISCGRNAGACSWKAVIRQLHRGDSHEPASVRWWYEILQPIHQHREMRCLPPPQQTQMVISLSETSPSSGYLRAQASSFTPRGPAPPAYHQTSHHQQHSPMLPHLPHYGMSRHALTASAPQTSSMDLAWQGITSFQGAPTQRNVMSHLLLLPLQVPSPPLQPLNTTALPALSSQHLLGQVSFVAAQPRFLVPPVPRYASPPSASPRGACRRSKKKRLGKQRRERNQRLLEKQLLASQSLTDTTSQQSGQTASCEGPFEATSDLDGSEEGPITQPSSPRPASPAAQQLE